MRTGSGRRATLAVMVGVLMLITVACGGTPHKGAVTSPPGPSTTSTISPSVSATTTVPTTTPVSTTGPAPASTSPAPASPTVPVTTTTLAPLQINGTVSDSSGRPVPGAVLIDADSLQVFHADSAGRFTVPYCTTLDQLWVASWVIPLGVDYRAAFGQPSSAGGSTTYFGSPPATAGPGYARMDRVWAQSATDPSPCHGEPVNVRLPAGGGVDITWLSKPMSGNPTPLTGPVNGYYEILPGLPYYAGTYTPVADSTGHQVMQQLGAGGMAINSSSTRFTCQGGDVQQTSGSSWQVPIVAGQTAEVTCTSP